MEGGCSCADNDEYLCSRVFSLMMVVTLAAIVVRGNVKLPTGRELFSILPVAVGGVGGSTTPLFASLLTVSLSHRRCCCCCCCCCILMWGRRFHPLIIGNLRHHRSCYYPATVVLVKRSETFSHPVSAGCVSRSLG